MTMTPSIRRALVRSIASLVALSSTSVMALAHHGIDGETPMTFEEGLLSGLGHPIVGLDHLVFILAAGMASGALALSLRMPCLFVLASLAGLFIRIAPVSLPMTETWVAASILLLGLVIGSRSTIGSVVWMTLFIGTGLIHGYAYGESVVGAAPLPLSGYLLGLALVQLALISLTHLAGHKLTEGMGNARPEMRHLGALLAVIGTVFFFAALRQGA
jgi:urease accessory protein